MTRGARETRCPVSQLNSQMTSAPAFALYVVTRSQPQLGSFHSRWTSGICSCKAVLASRRRAIRARVQRLPAPSMQHETAQDTSNNAEEQAATPVSESSDSKMDDLISSVESSAASSSLKSEKPQYSLRARLREETEAPFRKARMFVYGGSAVSAGVGAFIAGLRIIASLIGISGTQPLNETVR